MAPKLELSIPDTAESGTSSPYTLYNISIRLPLRSFTVQKRYSEFLDFHKSLINQVSDPPPVPLPGKKYFTHTVSNPTYREERRQGLERYIRAINEAEDAKWRSSSAWRTFLNLPTGLSATTWKGAALHAALTGPAAIDGSAAPITDPTMWLDCFRDVKTQLHDARLYLTRRDQETSPQKQHECSAQAKSSLHKAASLMGALEEGLRHLGNASGGNRLGDGEIRRRKDLLATARKEKEGLEALSQAMAAKVRANGAMPSESDKNALIGTTTSKSRRVLGKETDQTRELDNEGVLQLQKRTMQEQDLGVEELRKIIARQKELGIAINNELDIQNEMLNIVDDDVTRRVAMPILNSSVAMGQGQSSEQQDPASAGQSEAKTDYYTLLGVGRTATDDEIKKAYRRKALELHPDRNYGDVERTTALFADVQAAYEVLSDPQERAWYDSHRDQILSGEDADGGQYSHNVKMTTADDVNKIVLRFSPKMDFSDSPNGFFGGLRDIFDQLAKEEELACDWDGLEPVDYPTFGSKDDGADVVRPFYAVWSSFATKKSYAWKDKYKYSEAPDRRVRRIMEKENKKMREDGIKEFNEAVRSLVAFVKKRDPRYQASIQSDAQRQKSLRDSAAAQAARSRAANAKKLQEYVVPEWAKPMEDTEEIDEFANESEEELVDQYECVVCDKIFKSEKQLEAHERSKKHIKALKQLQKEMRKENGMMGNLGVEDIPEGQFTPVPDEEDYDILSGHSEPEHAASVEPGEAAELTEKTGEVDIEDDKASEDASTDSSEGNDDYAPREAVEERINASDPKYIAEDDEQLNEVQEKLSGAKLDDAKTKGEAEPVFKAGKAKQKRARRAAKATATGEPEIKCGVCHEEFTSKTKLFNHIREKDHAQLKTVDQKSKGGKKGKKRR
ncbi:hypothetical protein KEM54_006452 [Ascosphaera aggregata]|nr:hypothetical protein KEM54_006452 [Ascosphaera aggregata]